jgi:MHS family proline/betaine transporter-like MFS transporter
MASSVFLVEGAFPGKRGFMGSWSPFGASVGTLLGSAAGAVVNAILPPDAVMAYGWRIPFVVGLGVGLGGLVIRSHYVESVPHQPPAKSPLGEAFRLHWRTILHLAALSAGIGVGFYTSAIYASAWLAQVAGVPAKTSFVIDTVAMAISLVFILYAGRLSDSLGRRRVLVVVSGLLMVLALPLMALMARGQTGGILAGQILLLGLVCAMCGAQPAAMAELAPWRVRCTVVSIAYNLCMALLGGTTPLVAAWLVSRSGYALAPAFYLTAAAALSFAAALLLPRTVPHRLTAEFQAARSRAAHTPAS